MEGVKLVTDQECTDLIAQIDNLFSFLYKGVSRTYTYRLKHLTKDEYLVVIDRDRITPLSIYYPHLFNQLPYTLDDIVEVDAADWIANETVDL